MTPRVTQTPTSSMPFGWKLCIWEPLVAVELVPNDEHPSGLSDLNHIGSRPSPPPPYVPLHKEAFYDRCVTFPPKHFQDDGGPLNPKPSEGQSHFEKSNFLYTWAMGLFLGMPFDSSCWRQFSGGIWSWTSEKLRLASIRTKPPNACDIRRWNSEFES